MAILPCKKVLVSVCLFSSFVAMIIGIAGIAQQSAQEAPAGFNTPSFNSAASISNGIVEPPGDTFARDQNVYEANEAVKDGLGPVYNATSCVTCHQNPNSGAASQITELRVGHNDANGNFVNPTIFINDGQNTITGRSIVNDRAIGPQAQEHIPDTENIRTLRAALNTLGDGFVESIDDSTLIAIAERQPELSGEEFMGRLCRHLFSKLLGRPASDASAGRTSTAACSPLLPMPISTRWESRTVCAPRRLLKFLTPRRALTISPMTLAWRTSTTLLSSYAAPWFHLAT